MNQNSTFKPDETGRLSQESSKKYFTRIGLACFILGMVSMLISIASRLLIRDAFPWIASNGVTATLVSYGITLASLYVIALPLASLALNPLPRVSPIKEKMKASHIVAGICMSFMFTFVGSYISEFLVFIPTATAPLATTSTETLSVLSNNELIIHAIVLTLVFPILEELVFRKFLCSRILPLGEGYAVFLSAIIYGLVGGELYQFPHSFLIGIFFSFIYVKTGKIIYSIIFHVAINLYSTAIGIFLLAKIPIDDLLSALGTDASESEMTAFINEHIHELQIYLWTSIALIGLIIAGFIICYKAVKRGKFSLDSGIIPPEKKHRVSNILLSSGVAATVFFIAAKVILPMYVDRYL